MFTRHVVRFLAAALVLSVLPAAALASKARMESMLLSDPYTVDRVNVQTFPNNLFNHQNLVFAELGLWGDATDPNFDEPEGTDDLSDEDRSLGLYLGNLWEGKAGVFGIELNENYSPLSPIYGNQFVHRGGSFETQNESLALFWANQFGGLTLGVEANRMFSKEEDEFNTVGEEAPISVDLPDPIGTPGVDATRDMFAAAANDFGNSPWNAGGLGAGLGFERTTAGGNTQNFDLSVEARDYSFKQETGAPAATVTTESDNGISFAANVRALLQANQSLTWAPYLAYSTLDLGWKRTEAATPADNKTSSRKMTGFEGGIAGNWNLRQNDLLVAGLAFRSSTIDAEEQFDAGGGLGGAPANVADDTVKVKLTQPVVIFAAFEGTVFRWLSFRMGASKPVSSTLKIERPSPTDATESWTDSPFSFAIGTGFHFGNFTVDAVVNQDWSFTGGPLSSPGDNTPEYPFSRLSATYRY